MSTNVTVPAPRTTEQSSLDAVDAYMARALAGKASFAELLALVAIAEREMRRSDARIARAL